MSWCAQVFWNGSVKVLPIVSSDHYAVAVEVDEGVVEIDRRLVIAYEEVKK